MMLINSHPSRLIKRALLADDDEKGYDGMLQSSKSSSLQAIAVLYCDVDLVILLYGAECTYLGMYM